MELVLTWYQVLSRLSAWVSGPIHQLAGAVNVPLLTALLLGLLGATAPCQLTTSAGALAFITRHAGAGRLPLRLAAAYTAGKVAVFTLVGSTAIALGAGLGTETIPVFIAARKATGPLMLLVGLYLVGLLPLRLPGAGRLEAWARRAGARGDSLGAFLLGAAFSFAFCPTLFLLFFGVVMPLGLRTAGGWLLPPAFAVGTVLPLIALAYTAVAASDRLRARLRRAGGGQRRLQRLAGAVMILAGLNDTFLYWFL